MALNIEPGEDKVIIEAAPAEEKTASGIIIPDTAKEKPQKGTIVAVGPGKRSEFTGNLIPMTYNIGDVVVYGKYSGTETVHDGKDYLIMKQSDIHYRYKG